MYHPYLTQLLLAQYQDEQRKKTRYECQCCYCKSVKVKKPETESHWVQWQDLLKLIIIGCKDNIENKNVLYHDVFLHYIKMLGQSDEKNIKLANALCEFFDTPVKEEVKPVPPVQTSQPKKEEIKVEPQVLLNQIYTGLTGQTLPPNISDLVTSFLTKKEVNIKGCHTTLDELVKNLKKPEAQETKDCYHADSILDEFMKQDQ
jgi:hypothetical protein